MGRKAIAGLSYVQHRGDEAWRIRRPAVREAPWTINVDGQELVTLLCTPDKLNFPVLGFLAPERQMTIVGHVRSGKMNLHSTPGRVLLR